MHSCRFVLNLTFRPGSGTLVPVKGNASDPDLGAAVRLRVCVFCQALSVISSFACFLQHSPCAHQFIHHLHSCTHYHWFS